MKSKLKNLIVLCLILFLCVFSGCLESNDKNGYNEVGSEGLMYALNSNFASYDVVAYTGTEKNIIIPLFYKGLPVIGIRKLSNAKIKSINISHNVIYINSEAFSNCTSLESITIPNSVESIGESAFSDCKSLVIYCETESKPSEWDSNWNSSHRPVYYGVKEVIEQDGIQYLIIDGNAVITRYVGDSKEVEIPNTITYNNNTYNVTKIGDYAFDYSEITSITIPNSVTSIGKQTFYGCEALTSIILPNSLTSIGDYAFRNCTLLTIYCKATSEPSGWNSNWNSSHSPVYYGVKEVIEQDGIQYLIIDGNAVITRYVGKDSEVEIPSTITYNNSVYNVTEIGKYAFSYSEITSLIISNSVTSIGYYAFEDCTSLTIYCEAESKPSEWNKYWNDYRPVYWNVTKNDIIEQDGIQYLIIDGNAVVTSYVGKNSEVEIPSTITYNNNTYNVTKIGDYAFDYSEITSITIANSVESIGEDAFYNCTSLESIIIPNSVTSIGESTFENCTKLISITIPNSVTSIEKQTFYGCEALTSIILPNSVTSIGEDAFYNCTSLESIIIPNSVTSIGSYAFGNCTSLESIIIPNSVTSMDGFVFARCASITIYCEATSQPRSWIGNWNSSDFIVPSYYKVVWGYKGD